MALSATTRPTPTLRAARSSVTATPSPGTAAQASAPFQATSTAAGSLGHRGVYDGARATQARPPETHATPCSLKAARKPAGVVGPEAGWAAGAAAGAGAQAARISGTRTAESRRRMVVSLGGGRLSGVSPDGVNQA
ncbi:hypothetical protein CVO96_13375 [Deinococcus koreensis]|uniref:Uncharacterized protein n=1 Tax=Deinococcus koreensis TaxID=2054903 RepID=A0A2K3V0B0_9DEIO|nr:hypothetical protein CVO96_13375 [Deinococcus koreensis]